MDEIDIKLKALLASPERAEDRAFAERVRRRVLAEQRLTAAERKAWRRFIVEGMASLAVLVAFVLLARGAPEGAAPGIVPLSSPAMLGLVLLALWVTVAARSGVQAR